VFNSGGGGLNSGTRKKVENMRRGSHSVGICLLLQGLLPVYMMREVHLLRDSILKEKRLELLLLLLL